MWLWKPVRRGCAFRCQRQVHDGPLAPRRNQTMITTLPDLLRPSTVLPSYSLAEPTTRNQWTRNKVLGRSTVTLIRHDLQIAWNSVQLLNSSCSLSTYVESTLFKLPR